MRKEPGLGEEMADIAIYLFGITEILGIDLEKEIVAKVAKNKNRKYSRVDGILVRVKGG